MRKRTKVWLVTAVVLILVGGIVFGGVMSAFGWDFTKLSTVKYETNNYEITDAFNNISIDTSTADIFFALSNDGSCKVECYEEESISHMVFIDDGTLTIQMVDERSLHDYMKYIGINFGVPAVTVYLPNTEYNSLHIRCNTGNVKIPKDFHFQTAEILLSTGDVAFCASASELVKIKTTTGDISAEGVCAGALDLSVSTGKVTGTALNCREDLSIQVSTGKAYLADVASKRVVSDGNTGDIALKNVIASESFIIERSTGDITFEQCDAAEIFVSTDTGSVEGSFLNDKVFVTKTSTGSIDVPKTVTGGICEITTGTGNIKIYVNP